MPLWCYGELRLQAPVLWRRRTLDRRTGDLRGRSFSHFDLLPVQVSLGLKRRQGSLRANAEMSPFCQVALTNVSLKDD
jgi:hypothetical protein